MKHMKATQKSNWLIWQQQMITIRFDERSEM